MRLESWTILVSEEGHGCNSLRKMHTQNEPAASAYISEAQGPSLFRKHTEERAAGRTLCDGGRSKATV